MLQKAAQNPKPREKRSISIKRAWTESISEDKMKAGKKESEEGLYLSVRVDQ